ncbi:metal ABC transporter substrate-binding protein [Corynebacterium uterequi]|uniref:ABC-type metal ion transport system, periplasmic component/surface adhesin n=1 Tax=Corynebacterium uterequi TaxID=1072256 RepID=A0A0G3HCM6_9CORY|nr:zinc ABC transporter substrate-binding protein [Corynebacterium uterequi]AKK10465.1 ABC-type metal ion transport system, periplasmic component/surface adhesin [Corynebacterium uterequi]
MFLKKAATVSLALVTAGTLVACSTNSSTGSSSASSGASDAPSAAKDDQLTVYATTGYLADAVANIAPDAEVITMVGPGGDPHTYQPSTQDIQQIQDADVVVWNGLHLEAQMIDQLEALGDKQVAVGDKLPEDLLLPWEDNLHDPHIWNSPDAWTIVVDEVANKLSEINPDDAKTYAENADAYQAKIAEADKKAEEALAGVKNRILVTGHDAFNYFGATYDFEVHATDFVSTEAAKSASEISDLADYIVENKVKVIFQDNQANPQAITALKEAVQSRGWDVEISDTELFADTLGSEAPVDTYLGVFEHNASSIAEELSE